MVYISDMVDEETNDIIGELVDDYHETGEVPSCLIRIARELGREVHRLLEEQLGEVL